MSDQGGGVQPQQCRRGVTGDVELDAAMALADMAGVGPAAPAGQAARPVQQARPQPKPDEEEEEKELASTRLSLELGKVGIQSSSCSSSSSAGCPAAQQVPAAGPGYGPRPRHVLTETEKEAKRLRRVLANRESARQTILRRQAIRDELARKVADLSSQNESMKKEKETVMQEYLTLKETNKQLKEQVVAKTTRRSSAPATTTGTGTEPLAQQAEAMPSTASQPAAPLQQSFLYATAAPPAVPVPYVWGSWAPGYEEGHAVGAGQLSHPPCAWYYPVVADPLGSPPASYAQPLLQEPTSGAGSGTAEEDTDDDPCSLTLGLDVDRRSAPGTESGSREAPGTQGVARGRATAAEARKRRKELTKLKQMHSGGRPEDE